MENLPNTERGQATKIYLEIAVEQDLKSLGYEYCSQQFNRNLNSLHDMQHLVVFTDGWIRPTRAGLGRQYGSGQRTNGCLSFEPSTNNHNRTEDATS